MTVNQRSFIRAPAQSIYLHMECPGFGNNLSANGTESGNTNNFPFKRIHPEAIPSSGLLCFQQALHFLVMKQHIAEYIFSHHPAILIHNAGQCDRCGNAGAICQIINARSGRLNPSDRLSSGAASKLSGTFQPRMTSAPSICLAASSGVRLFAVCLCNQVPECAKHTAAPRYDKSKFPACSCPKIILQLTSLYFRLLYRRTTYSSRKSSTERCHCGTVSFTPSTYTASTRSF